MISKFALYFRINFKKELQYRAAAFSSLLTQLFFGMMFILIYMAFYESNGTPTDFNLAQMSTYIWLQQAFLMMFRYYDSNRPLTQKIINGDISYQLLKPVPLYSQWYYDYYTLNLSKTLIRAVGIVTICWFFPWGAALALPVSFEAFVLFLVSILLGSFLVVAINMLSYTLLTITLSPVAVFTLVHSIGALFSGQIIPIPLMPQWFQTIISFFPFRYVSDLAFRIYVGNISTQDALLPIAIQIVWLVVIVGLGKWWLHKRSLKLIVQGG